MERENRREKVIINSGDIGSLEDVLGPNDSLFQPDPEFLPQENKQKEKDVNNGKSKR